MMKLSLMEFLLIAIPEAFLLIWASCLLSGKKIDKRLYFTSSLLLASSVYLIRLLPIHLGVNNILNIIVLIVVLVSINKIPTNTAIYHSLALTVLTFLCEWVNFYIINNWTKIDLNNMENNIPLKILLFMPSMVLFVISIMLVYLFIYKPKKEGVKDVCS